MRSFDQSVTGIGVLADPVRRRLYRFVCSQAQPVSRDQAAQAIGVARHKAKFHLDRLEAEGLLEADYVRLTGRAGPGAGRPAKRYRRGRSEFAVSLPARDYELAGRIMAGTTGDRPSSSDGALELAGRILNDHGYEPRRVDHAVVMTNCPFHALAVGYTELVCQMNHALLSSFADSLAPELLDANFEPGAHRCCVLLTALAVPKRAARSTATPESVEPG